MASRTEIDETLLKPMTARFSAPRGTTDQATILAEYAQDLAGYPAAELADAWVWLRRNHPRMTWPLFKEIQNALAEVYKAHPSQTPKAVEGDKRAKAHRQRLFWEEEAKVSSAYPEAQRAGVALAFTWLAGDEQRQLTYQDIPHAKARWAKHVEKVDPSRPFYGLGVEMLKKNEEMCHAA